MALAKNNGSLNEMELGELLGLEDEVTRQIIAQLIFEHKIEYHENGFCNYRVFKESKVKKSPAKDFAGRKAVERSIDGLTNFLNQFKT